MHQLPAVDFRGCAAEAHNGPSHECHHRSSPPPEEQEQIVKVQNEETGPLRAAIKQANREITLLREYRTRLIADLVTGKLDVREAASQLPDEDQELPLIDGLDEVNDPENDAVDDLDEAPEDSEP